MTKALVCAFIIIVFDLLLVASGDLDSTMQMVLVGGAIFGALSCFVSLLDKRAGGWAMIVFGALHLPLGALAIWGGSGLISEANRKDYGLEEDFYEDSHHDSWSDPGDEAVFYRHDPWSIPLGLLMILTGLFSLSVSMTGGVALGSGVLMMIFGFMNRNDATMLRLEGDTLFFKPGAIAPVTMVEQREVTYVQKIGRVWHIERELDKPLKIHESALAPEQRADFGPTLERWAHAA